MSMWGGSRKKINHFYKKWKPLSGCCSTCVPVCATPAVPAAALILQQCPASCLRPHQPPNGTALAGLGSLPGRPHLPSCSPTPPRRFLLTVCKLKRQTGCTSGKQTTGTPLIKGLSDPHSPPLPAEEGSSGHAPAKSHVSIPSRPPRPRERGRPRPVAHQLLAVPPGTTPPSTCPLQRVLSAPPPVRRRRAASPPEDPGERLRLRSELQRVSPAA